jgi:exodeoxyribonuclease VII small subunit
MVKILKENSKETFESALQKLEMITEKLENIDIDLEKALTLYEEGIQLTEFCSTKLNEAKKRIDILVKKDGNKLERAPYEGEDE